MIRIERTSCPACLTGSSSARNRYRKKKVVTALWEMQHGKCCYSEVSIPPTGHGKAVEHFDAKSVFIWKRNEWENLLLVCPQCNGKKSDYFPVMLTDNENETKVVYLSVPSSKTRAIIDPSSETEDPENNLTYILDNANELYGQVIPRNGDVRGRTTIDVTGIDDGVFYRQRFDLLNETLDVQFRNLLRAAKSGDAERIELELKPFRDYVQSDRPFAGLAREYARVKKMDQRFGLEIPGRS